MRRKILIATGCLAGLLLALPLSYARAEPGDAARLGRDLTPLGAEKAGNADGTIPAWTGGITQPPPGYKPGGRYVDPYASDKILFTITAANMAKYADKLSDGEKAMLKAYPDTFKINVYPCRRSASAPQRIYDATRKNAETAERVKGGLGVRGVIGGVPFPVPRQGTDLIWNHITRWRGVDVDRTYVQAAVLRGGEYTPVLFHEKVLFNYSVPGQTEKALNNIMIFFKQSILSPPRLAGRVLLIHETLNQAEENRQAWVYNPGQRRVRRAPNVAFDNPKEGADGLMTFDQLDLFNGSPERYNWKLIGKKEIYIPYNAYRMIQKGVTYNDILKPGHLNPDLLRYELHRVWVVVGTLKKGTRHLYGKRVLYFDEDSWQAALGDEYDNRGELWRVSEGHGINYYDVPTFWYTAEVHYDLQSRRYVALLSNVEKPYNFRAKFSAREFTTEELRMAGRR